MNFEIEKKDFMKNVTFVQKAITGKSTLQILEGILIEAKDNKIILKGSNTITTIITECNAKVIEEGSIIVDSKLLGEMKKFQDGIMSFSSNDNQSLNIKVGRSKAKLPIMGDKTNFPEVQLISDTNSLTLNSTVLKELIKGTSFAAAIDDTRPILTGLLFECNNNSLSVVGLDGYRLAVKKVDIQHSDFEIIIPSKSINELFKIIEDEIEIKISYDKSNVMFSFDNITLLTRLLEGSYIKYNSLIPVDNDIKLEINTSVLKKSLESCMIIDKEKNLIKLEISNNTILVKSSSVNGEIEEEIDCVCNNNLTIAFNGKYLIDMCNSINGDIVMYLKTPTSPCLIKEKNSENTKQLVLPVRILH